MKFKKQKISMRTTLYYVQKPDQRLVQLVRSHFEFEMGHVADQADKSRITRAILKNMSWFLACLYHDLENEILDLLPIEKIFYWIHIILLSQFLLTNKMRYRYPKTVERYLHKWGPPTGLWVTLFRQSNIPK
jgi:hypothetical protein